MNLPIRKEISLEEFFSLREKSTQVMEYIDGTVFMSPSPSIKHQRISGKLYVQLAEVLENSECEVFAAPTDIELNDEGKNETHIVIPDLSVICDKNGFAETKYVGVPNLIIEIISPSNQSHDLVYKLNLYEKFGVKEYWTVNPLINHIQVFFLEEGQYIQSGAAKDTGTVKSSLFDKFEVDAGRLFS